MSSSWSDLPLDLLIIIKNKLQSYECYNIFSFRSVCTQWRSAVPASNPLPCYDVSFNNNHGTIYFRLGNNESCRSILLPRLFQSSPVNFLCSSNGWLIFLDNYNKNLYLFDPVSNLKLIFPPVSLRLLRHYRKFEPIVKSVCHIVISKVIVSSSVEGGIAVACIILIVNRETLIRESRLIFCRYGNRPRWNVMMEESKDISDIALAGDNRFYAISKDWMLYMIDERPPMLGLKRFKLLLPKYILEPDDPPDDAYSNICHYIFESGESHLKIYGIRWRHWGEGKLIYFKLDVTKLHDCINDDTIACVVERAFDKIPHYYSKQFIPSLRERTITQSCSAE